MASDAILIEVENLHSVCMRLEALADKHAAPFDSIVDHCGKRAKFSDSAGRSRGDTHARKVTAADRTEIG